MEENDIDSRPAGEIVEKSKNEEAEDHDTHRCGKCKVDFKSIEEFIRHKLDKDNCKVLYTSRHRRVLLPHLVKKPIKTEIIPPGGDASKENLGGFPVIGQKRKRGRPPNSKAKTSHILPEAIIERQDYTCLKCQKTFHRESTLKRHVEIIHDAVTLSDEEDGYDAIEPEVFDEDGTDEDFGSAQVINPSSQNAVHVEPKEGLNEEENLAAISSALEGLQDMAEGNSDSQSNELMPNVRAAGQNLVEVALMQAKIIEMPAPSAGLSMKSERGTVKSSSQAGKRLHECEVCQRRFRELPILRAHMLTHSNKRDYHCPFTGCPYAFKTKGSLKRHIRRHTGERPYKCYMCSRAFRESGALTRHLKSRMPCLAKTDADLPRYGSQLKLHCDEEGKEESPLPADGSGSPCDGEGEEQALEKDGAALTGAESQEIHVPCEEMQDPETESICQGVPMTEMEVHDEDNMVDTEGVAYDEAQRLACQSTVKLVCEACGMELPSHLKLKEHLEDHIDFMPVYCDLCSFTAETKKELNEHMKNTHPEKFEELEKASKTNNEEDSQESEETPKEIAEGNEEKQAEEGSKPEETEATPGGDEGEKKAPEEAEDKEQPTQETGAATDDEDDFLKKEATIAMEQMLKMGYRTSLSSLDRDLAHKYKYLRKCPYCSRTFRGGCYLKVHMRTHTGERPHKCIRCLKRFMTRDALNKHLFVHSDERQYKCGECGKLFKRISHVREHLKTHTNDRPYVCQHCDKGFKTPNALKVHTRTHTLVMPWQCKACHKRFREKASLERHVRTHTGEKPYSCTHCGRKFAEHGSLNRHLKAKVPCTKSLYLERNGEMMKDQDLDLQQEPEEFPTVLAQFSSVVADTQHYIVPSTSTGQTEEEGTEVVVLGTEELTTEDGSNIIEILADGNNQIISEDGTTTAYVLLSQDDEGITVLDSNTGETLQFIHPGGEEIGDVIQVPSSLEVEDGSQLVAIDASTFHGELKATPGITEDQINEAIAIVTETPIAVDSGLGVLHEGVEHVGEIEAVAMVPTSTVEDTDNTNFGEQIVFSVSTSS